MRILEAAQAVATFLRRRPLTRNLRTPDKSDRGGAEQSFRWSKECTGSKDEATLKRDIEQLRKTGNFAEASRVIEDALVQFPSSVSILTERGWLHHDQHHYDEAISDFDKVLHIDRSNEGALQGKIAQLRLKGSAIDPAFFDQAHDLLREALKYHPKSLGLLSERGWLFLAQKQYDRATKAFVEVQNVPGFQQVMAQLRAQRRLAEASTLIENIPPPFNQNLAVICERAWLSFSKRQYDEAITLFDQVLASEMKHAAKEGAFQGLSLIHI